MNQNRQSFKELFNITVLIYALGYFDDMYDLILFGIVRIPSLTSMGVKGDDLINIGVFLLNMQMAEMLIGGIIWGEKRGRISVLFGSIFLYSTANLRTTVTTMVPNFIRRSVLPITLAFTYLRASLGIVYSARIVGIFCIAIALFQV